MAEGYRSLEGLWIGGIGSPQPAGYRSLLGFWIGGVSKPSGVQAGYRSFMGLWIGGTNAPTETPVIVVGGGSPVRRRKREAYEPFDLTELLHEERLLRDDEDLILLLSNL